MSAGHLTPKARKLTAWGAGPRNGHKISSSAEGAEEPGALSNLRYTFRNGVFPPLQGSTLLLHYFLGLTPQAVGFRALGAGRHSRVGRSHPSICAERRTPNVKCPF